MKYITRKLFLLFVLNLFAGLQVLAQGDTKVSARLDANKIAVGDQARLFIEAQHNTRQGLLQWATIPDTFNSLEVVEKGKIDTVKQGDIVTYKQRLLITGFDSGVFVIPAMTFPVIPVGGTAYTVQTDSIPMLVQTVAVDTSKPFKGIKGIITVKSSWLDYLWLIIGVIILIVLTVFVVLYFKKNKKAPAPVIDNTPKETLQQRYLRLLGELESKQLWQRNTVESIKDYYTQLTDILRSYIEERFNTSAMELTTDELLEKAKRHRELSKQESLLASIWFTADLAKFARAQPTPAEHIEAMDNAKQFVNNTKPVITDNTQQAS